MQRIFYTIYGQSLIDVIMLSTFYNNNDDPH